MTDLCLWLLLVTATLFSLVRATDKRDSSESVRRNMPTASFALGGFLGMASTGLWIWLTFITGHWQFAAISIQGVLIALAADMGRKS